MEVSDLYLNTYSSVEDLQAEEELWMYPPRFKVSVNCLSHCNNLETEFKIILENNDVLDFDKAIKFPLIITKSTTTVQLGKIVSIVAITTYVCSVLYLLSMELHLTMHHLINVSYLCSVNKTLMNQATYLH